MMKRSLCALIAALTAAIISGCGHTPVREVFPAALPPQTADDQVVAERTARFQAILAPAQIRGVGVFPSAFQGIYSNADVLNAVQSLGFNRIYCQLISERELNDDLVEFLTLAAERDIPVELVFSQQDFYRRYRSNRLIRDLFIQYPDLAEAVAEAVEFNLELPENIRIAGITVVLTPHLFNGNNTERIRGQLYRWDEKRYGIGEDNDMLVRESLEYLRRISELPGLPPLTAAVPDFFHEAAKEGKLSCGKIDDFARYASCVAVISSANLPSRVFESIRQELTDAGSNVRLLAAVPLASHTALDQGSLRRRNWLDFQRTIDNLVKQSAQRPAFQGVILSPLAVIEYLRREK